MKVKCYYGNYDGTRHGLIVANSQKVAAGIAKISLYDFKKYWSQGSWPKDFTPKPFTLYLKKDYKDEWQEDIK